MFQFLPSFAVKNLESRSTPQSRAQSTPQSTLQRNYNRYKPEQYDSDVDDSNIDDSDVEEVAIDEKFKLIDLETEATTFRAAQRSNHEMRKKCGLLLLMNAESGSFNNVIVSYRYVRKFIKLLEHYKSYQIFVGVVQDEFTATSGYNAGNTITNNKLEFCADRSGALKKLTTILPRKMFVDKFDDNTAAEIAEQVYNNEDKKAGEYFCVWSARIDQKDQEIEERKRQIKRRAARGYRPAVLLTQTATILTTQIIT